MQAAPKRTRVAAAGSTLLLVVWHARVVRAAKSRALSPNKTGGREGGGLKLLAEVARQPETPGYRTVSFMLFQQLDG